MANWHWDNLGTLCDLVDQTLITISAALKDQLRRPCRQSEVGGASTAWELPFGVPPACQVGG